MTCPKLESINSLNTLLSLSDNTGAACQYHHMSKTHSHALQDPPRRRTSTATPP